MQFIRQHLAFTIFLFITILVSGCQSRSKIRIEPTVYFYDQGFAGFENIEVETEEQVFELDDAAREFVRRSVGEFIGSSEQMKEFVHDIFDHSKFNLLYQGDANTTASETFHARAANCLSMSIMTYSLAREAGFGVKFQEVEIPEYWTRRAGYSLLNGHINLQLAPRPAPNVYNISNWGYEVDFDPQNGRRSWPKKYVAEDYVLSMFYNNKAADALLSEDFIKAYAYLRASLKLTPHFTSAWVNLGVLYRFNQLYDQAEKAYQQAILINPDNLTAWENLGYLYQLSEQSEKAMEIFAKVELARKNNPYYHLILGEQEFENDNLEYALQHFRSALKLDRNKHEIYFALAKTYYRMGELKRSQQYLERAKRESRSRHQQREYQGKLDLLSRL